MKNFGINYKISKNNGPKQGKLPSIDIETLEKSIEKIEQELKVKPDAVHVEYLLELYSIAVEYYSAGNDPKYQVYKNKTQEIMKSENLTKLVDQEVIEHNKTIEDEVRNDNDSKEAKKENFQESINEVVIASVLEEPKNKIETVIVEENKSNINDVDKKEQVINKIEVKVEKDELNKPKIEIEEPKNEEIGKIAIVTSSDEQVKIYDEDDEEDE
jgi:hypothetical protein